MWYSSLESCCFLSLTGSSLTKNRLQGSAYWINLRLSPVHWMYCPTISPICEFLQILWLLPTGRPTVWPIAATAIPYPKFPTLEKQTNKTSKNLLPHKYPKYKSSPYKSLYILKPQCKSLSRHFLFSLKFSILLKWPKNTSYLTKYPVLSFK